MTQDKADIAVEFAEHGVKLMEKAAGAEHPVTQNWRFILAMVVFHAGAVEKSLEINEDILRIRKMVIGEFNHLTLESYSTCAALLLRLNRAQKAEYVRFPLRRSRADSPVFEGVCSPSA